MASRFKINLICLVAILALGAISPSATASLHGKCEDLLHHMHVNWRLIKEASKNYAFELKESRGARLLFAPATEPPLQRPGFGFLEPKESYYSTSLIGRLIWPLQASYQFLPRRVIGLFRATQGHWTGCLKGDPDYVFSFGQGVQTCLIDGPIYAASNLQLLRKHLQLQRQFVGSFLLSAALFAPPLIWGLNQVSALKAEQIAKTNEELTQSHLGFFIEKLKYDVRFKYYRDEVHHIWSSDQKENLDLIQQTLQEIQILHQSNLSFLIDFDLKGFTGETDRVAEILNFPQFVHLRRYKNKKVAAETWRSLVYAHWMMHQALEIIPALMNEAVSVQEQIKSSPLQFQEYIHSLQTADFYGSVMQHRRQNEFTGAEATGLLRLWIYTRTRLLEAQLLGLQIPNFSIVGYEQEIIAEALTNKKFWSLPGSDDLWISSQLFSRGGAMTIQK